MWNKAAALALCLLGWAAVAAAQPAPAAAALPASVDVRLPQDAPVALVESDWSESRSSARGGAMVLDLRLQLSLRNVSTSRIRALTLLVQAEKVTPGGKASVSIAGLNVDRGQIFPVRMDLRLMRPLLTSDAELVTVELDGVLFDDLSFYGPDTLESRRALTAQEFEARRDRGALRNLLEAEGEKALQDAMLALMDRQAQRKNFAIHVSRGGRATARTPERETQFAFLKLPGAPIEPVAGLAHVAGNESISSIFEVVNRSMQPVRYFEIGYIVRDEAGREFAAGSIPATSHPVAPGSRGTARQTTRLRFTKQNGRPIEIEGFRGYISLVEFADGTLWIPSRADLEQPGLAEVSSLSPEQERLLDVYRKRGLAGLMDQLRRF